MMSKYGARDISEYELEEKIGSGTYGSVFRGRNRKTKTLVALKQIIIGDDGRPGFEQQGASSFTPCRR
jgi:serine/threonine protein kinase